MDATAGANALRMPTNLSILATKCFQSKPQFLNFNFSSIFLYPGYVKNAALFPTHCSASKPSTNKDDAATENLSAFSSLTSRTKTQASTTFNQGISSSLSMSRGLIFDLGSDDSWDSVEIGSPVVKRYLSDEEERWYMWYYGRSVENPDFDSIGLAVSSNGIHWERGAGGVRSNADVGLVMSSSKDWWAFDTHSVRPCEVAVMSSSKVRTNSAVYWLYYTGFSSEKIESLSNSLECCSGNPENTQLSVVNDYQIVGGGKFLKSLPGLAMSQDGRHWARIEGEHHSGALIDVGSDGEWDSSFIASPQVVFHGNGDLRMYYHSLDVTNGHFSIGIARSRDGMRWVKLGKVMGGGANGSFDECGRANPCVLRNKKDGKYLMVYEGVASGGKRRSIGMVVSSDGLGNWENVKEGPVFEQSKDGEWDCEGVGMPYLVQMDGDTDEWRLYYRGIGKGGRTGIGLAVSESQSRNFQRWTGFHL